MTNDAAAMTTTPPATGGGKRRIRKPRKKRYQQDQRQEAGQGQDPAEEKRTPAGSNHVNEKRRKKKKHNDSGAGEEPDKKNVGGDGDGGAKPRKYRKKRGTAPRQQKEEAPMGQREQEQPRRRRKRQEPAMVREEKQQIPATNFVSSVKPKINLIQHRPPPYSSLPPRHCDKTKMTIVKLSNVDIGVDTSLLFWAFKHCGWIDNVYIVRRSFSNRQFGVAFIGFRSDWAAAQAVSRSGCEQLFSRRIKVEIYANRKQRIHLFNLPILPLDMLTKVFEHLDWRTRIGCEAVCKRFNNALKEMYDLEHWYEYPQHKKQQWKGLPEKIGFVFTTQTADADKKDAAASSETILTIRVPAEPNQCNDILRSILRKFSRNISSLEFHNAVFDSITIQLILSGGLYLQRLQAPRWDAGRILLEGVIFNDVCCEDLGDFWEHYGDRLTTEEFW